MSHMYVLKGKTPVEEKDAVKWGKFHHEDKNRRIGHDTKLISTEVRVSTVFLGIDHGFGEGPPVLFETMVFGGEFDQEQERYCTWDQAEKGHKRWVGKALS